MCQKNCTIQCYLALEINIKKTALFLSYEKKWALLTKKHQKINKEVRGKC